MQKDIDQEIRRLNQQKMVFQAENEVLKKNLQELQDIKIKYDNIINSRKYKLLNTFTGNSTKEPSLLGENGEKLTCVFQGTDDIWTIIDSLWRLEEDFKGEIVIILRKDDLSLQSRLTEYFSDKQIQWRMFLTEKKCDVYEVLNRVVEIIATDWFCYVDSNYVYTKPFLNTLNVALKETGSYFLNLPVRDQKSNWLFGNQFLKRSLMMGAEEKIVNPEIPYLTKTIPRLTHVLNLHALVIKKDAFEQLGKFNSEYKKLQGLELAYRIIKNGLGISNCKSVFLSGIAECDMFDLSSEETILKLFKEEYGYGITNAADELDGYVKKENRLRVAIVVDVENWAYHNIAKQVQSYLREEIDIDLYFDVYASNAIQLVFALKDYDIIHFMWRGNAYILSERKARAYFEQIGMTYEEFKDEYLDKICITTSVYDHMFLEKEDEISMTCDILETCDEYTVSSELLADIYEEKFSKKSLNTVTDGVDLDKFYPLNKERFENRNDKKLVIGWVGNSKFFGMQDKDLKGVNTILKPAIMELQAEGVPVEQYFADRQERMIPHDKMCEYYSDIDVLVCTSLLEGTPNPVLEAMACGVPIISTNVGIVQEALGEFQKQFILKERNIECLKKAIMEMIEHPEYLLRCSNENLESIKKWDWKYKAQDFKEFFEKTYRKHGRDKL